MKRIDSYQNRISLPTRRDRNYTLQLLQGRAKVSQPDKRVILIPPILQFLEIYER